MADELVPEIDVTEAFKRTDAGQGTLLDVREPMEWDAGHAPGAIHRPLGTLDLSEFADAQPVVVICQSGGRSAEATRRLRAEGIDAINVAGGMSAWEMAGQPVIRDDGGDGLVI